MITPIARNPQYCCDGFEWYGDHLRCVNLELTANLEYKCGEGIPMDEDQMPPEMDCHRRIEMDTAKSVLSEVAFVFSPRRS